MIGFSVVACDQNETVSDTISFDELAAELGFDDPISEKGQELILEKFNSVEQYRDFLLDRIEYLKSKNRTSSILDSKDLKSLTMGKYVVKLITPDGEEEFRCSDDTYIFDRAEENGIDLPSSCRAGACSSCVSILAAGSVDQEDQTFFSNYQIESEGAVVLCVAYPTSDVTIVTHC